MKKMFIIIIILVIIFIGMILYNKIGKSNQNTNVTIEEINNIEEYINKIYMWKEVTNEALPTFENINVANKTWIWEVVKKNIEKYEFSYEEIENKAKELFGEEFQVQFPKEGFDGIKYNNDEQKYIATETVLDEQEDSFLLNNIYKNKEGYIIEIVEYIEDYSLENNIVVRNLKGEELGKVSNSESETKIQEIVKDNIDRFKKKKIYLKNEIIVEKIEEE